MQPLISFAKCSAAASGSALSLGRAPQYDATSGTICVPAALFRRTARRLAGRTIGQSEQANEHQAACGRITI
jgi:hypothetical protein